MSLVEHRLERRKYKRCVRRYEHLRVAGASAKFLEGGEDARHDLALPARMQMGLRFVEQDDEARLRPLLQQLGGDLVLVPCPHQEIGEAERATDPC